MAWGRRGGRSGAAWVACDVGDLAGAACDDALHRCLVVEDDGLNAGTLGGVVFQRIEGGFVEGRLDEIQDMLAERLGKLAHPAARQ